MLFWRRISFNSATTVATSYHRNGGLAYLEHSREPPLFRSCYWVLQFSMLSYATYYISYSFSLSWVFACQDYCWPVLSARQIIETSMWDTSRVQGSFILT